MIGKIGGCTPAARWIARMPWVDSIAFGFMMNTKGLIALGRVFVFFYTSRSGCLG
jgi:Kef-type K+ transport system membrane component KefB